MTAEKLFNQIFAFRRTLAALLILMGLAFSATPAAADFRLCNNTASRVGIALGYKDNDGWTTEGWWNVSAKNCETLLKGALVARYYYIYAVDYDRGGEWSGQAFMCSKDKEFTIRGIEDCLARLRYRVADSNQFARLIGRRSAGNPNLTSDLHRS